MATKPDAGEKLIASNKKAFHDYFVLQKAEAGVALTGTEVKSLRDGKANIKDSYVIFKGGEADVKVCLHECAKYELACEFYRRVTHGATGFRRSRPTV